MKSCLCLSVIFALTLLRAAAQSSPVQAELFPPDFLLSRREALGLNEAQLQDIQAIMLEVQTKFEALKGQLEERGRALAGALHQATLDIAGTEEKLRSLLAQENEMKILQLRLMLTLRSKLTPEQVAKARELLRSYPPGPAERAGQPPSSQNAGSDPRIGLPERLGRKFEELKTAMQERAFGGAPPEEIVRQVGEIQRLAQEGQPLEAERRIDALIIQLREGQPKR